MAQDPQNPDFPFAGGDQPISEPFRHQSISARVPERCVRGSYSTGQLVLDGPKEFIIDFLQGLTRPHQVTARVVMTPDTFTEFATALQTNLDHYTRTFGPPPPMPTPPQQPKPSIQEIYDNFKLPDDMLSGSYANQVLIGHSPTEFFFDFITGFFPTPAVSARVYIPASVVPKFLTTLRAAEQNRKRAQEQREREQRDQDPENTI